MFSFLFAGCFFLLLFLGFEMRWCSELKVEGWIFSALPLNNSQ